MSDQGTYYGQLSVVRERGTVGSVMLMSSSAKTISACFPAAAAVTESITFTDAASPTPPIPTDPTDAAASPGSLVGSWGVDTALRQNNSDNWIVGYVRFQYDLRVDGTYAFRKEIKFDGSPKTTYDSYAETGRYAVDGTRVTITPKAAKHVKRDLDGKVLQSDKVVLEKVTYAWRLDVQGSSGEVLLILTPGKATTRDGTPNGGDYARGGYILSSAKKLAWNF